MKKLFSIFMRLFESDQQRIERYLSRSQDLADLEQRMKELDRTRFSDNFYL